MLRILAATVLAKQNRALLAELAFLRAENSYYRRLLPAQRLTFTLAWRRRFAEAGAAIGWTRLKKICTVASAKTIQRWHQALKKGLLGQSRKQGPGRPRTDAETETLIVRMRTENDWGIHRISGELLKLKIKRCPQTVANILRRHVIEPLDPNGEGRTSTWKPFIAAHGHEIAATDFFTVDVWSWLGKTTAYVLFAIHLATRKVEILGVTEHPDEAFMKQIARNVTMDDVGWLKRIGAKYLIHDHDTKFCESFVMLLKTGGVEAIKLPPNSPNLNAFAERWVRSVKSDCLRKITCLGFGGLGRALSEYMVHYHAERPHQSLGNAPPDAQAPVQQPDDQAGMGKIGCQTRLGGVLKHYYREAA
ncbi:MAG: transposase [Planctomycetes bacterium]|nr:transposase [Planctomycetota bacterium]